MATKAAAKTATTTKPQPPTLDAAQLSAQANLATAVSERAFMDAVIAYARLTHWRVYHTHDSRHSPAGWPDLILVRDGNLIAAECKRQTGCLTPAQREWLTDLRAVPGMWAVCWRPADWRDIEVMLRDLPPATTMSAAMSAAGTEPPLKGA